MKLLFVEIFCLSNVRGNNLFLEKRCRIFKLKNLFYNILIW